MRHPSLRAFTIVELLVVATMFAVLIALLLPAMGKAKLQAQRIVCLNNLKQQGIALASYAEAYREVMPLGYRASNQVSYWVYYTSGTAQRPIALGLLTAAGFIRPPSTFFCPTYIDHAFHGLNTVSNPIPRWPPSTIGVDATGVRSTYCARPALNLAGTADWAWTFSSNAFRPTNWPRQHQLANRAIVSDLNHLALAAAHVGAVSGMNVLFENGSARLIPRKTLADAGMSSLPSTSAGSPLVHSMWDEMDRN